MKRLVFSFLIVASSTLLMSQTDQEYYKTIPENPEIVTAVTMLVRSIDGLGFRYYHATEGLTVTDLEYSAGNGGRRVIEILQHLYGLTEMVNNAVHNTSNIRPSNGAENLSFEELRAGTLSSIKAAREKTLTLTDAQLAECQVIFERAGEQSGYPIWNLINGPLADAMWHTGQVVSHRRAAGNPINPKVSVFLGTLRD